MMFWGALWLSAMACVLVAPAVVAPATPVRLWTLLAAGLSRAVKQVCEVPDSGSVQVWSTKAEVCSVRRVAGRRPTARSG